MTRRALSRTLLTATIVSSLLAVGVAFAQNRDARRAAEAGRAQYESRCSRCHGENAAGGESGPNIQAAINARNDSELAALVREGRPATGMPSFTLTPEEMDQLIGHLRFLAPIGGAPPPPVRKTVRTTDGRTLEGLVLGEGTLDLQLRTDDKRVHLLRVAGDRYRRVTSQVNWPTYHGSPSANRYSTLTQVDKRSVGRLRPEWIAALPNVPGLENTPVVVDGIMYVSSANEVVALDAGSGRTVWHFQRPRTKGVFGNAAGGFNRGVAVAADRVFLLTDNAHLLALNRFTGELLWETVMADFREGYNGTSAPLIVGALVVSGTAGGDEGARGFLAAFDQQSGKEVWRFWTVPKPGERGSETWTPEALAHPSASAWMTGSYDPELNIVYWAVGNPGPDLDGDERSGDNLYSDSVLALDATTGTLKWYYQFTPHDIHDWDAQEPLVLVDAKWQGQPHKLLIQANRNGFFYVLDRVTGGLLLAKPFVHKMNWAEGIDKNGRPILKPLPDQPGGGSYVCPGMVGGTNWFSTSFNPTTGFFYVQALESCNVFTVRHREWELGRLYMGGSSRAAANEAAQKFLRAINIETGDVAWELPHTPMKSSFGGVLSTAAGLVFFGESSGAFVAADATSGKVLWQFQANQGWRTSPMTYLFDNKQYVAIAAGQSVIAFALP